MSPLFHSLRIGIITTTLLLVFTARTHAQDCTPVHATVSGIAVGDRLVDGFIHGDMNGRTRTDMRPIRLTIGGFGLLEGRTSYSTTNGTLQTRDLIMIFPGPGKDMLVWSGHHEVMGGSGSYEGAKGFLKSAGFLELKSGLLKYNLMGRVCFNKDDKGRAQTIAKPTKTSKKPVAARERQKIDPARPTKTKEPARNIARPPKGSKKPVPTGRVKPAPTRKPKKGKS